MLSQFLFKDEYSFDKNIVKLKKKDYTGLPTKDKTSETTVRNLYCLISDINDSLFFPYQFKTSLKLRIFI